MNRSNRSILVALLLCGFLVALAGAPALAAEPKEAPKQAVTGGLEDVIPPLVIFESGYCESDCCWAYCEGEGCSVTCSNSGCTAQSGGQTSTTLCPISPNGPE